MSAFFKQHFVRATHAKISAEDERTSGKTGLLVLIIILITLIAIALRMAEFSLRPGRHTPPPPPPPAVAIFSLL
jgi:hypothetical protein